MAAGTLPDPSHDAPRLWSQREIVHFVGEVVREITGPIAEQVKRIAGDGPDSELPESLRNDGILVGIGKMVAAQGEENRTFQTEQRTRNTAVDAYLSSATTERKEIVARLTEIEKRQFRLRRTLLRFYRWLTRKDDGTSVAVLKIAALLTAVLLISNSVHNLWPVAKHALHSIIRWINTL